MKSVEELRVALQKTIKEVIFVDISEISISFFIDFEYKTSKADRYFADHRSGEIITLYKDCGIAIFPDFAFEFDDFFKSMFGTILKSVYDQIRHTHHWELDFTPEQKLEYIMVYFS